MRVRTWLLPLASLTAVVGVTAWEFSSARMGPGPLHPAHAQIDSLSGGQCASCHRAGAGIDPDACIACHRPIGDQRTALTGLHGSLPATDLAQCNKCHREHHGARTPLIAPQAFSNAGVPDVAGYDHRHVADYRLAGAHRALACDQCHPAATAAMPPPGGRFLGASQACGACHDDVHRGAFGRDCEDCHGQEQEFGTAPGFQHQIFPLVGAHSRVSCVDCHKPGTPHATASLSLRPQPARTCAQCHEDPHRPSGSRPARAMLLGNTHDCSRCHEPSAWATANVTPEQHAQFGFPLRGGHAAAECASCHGDGTRPSRHAPPMPGVAACARCHEENPHEATFLRAARVAKGRQDGCAGCHDDADRTFREGRTTPQQHAVTGFLLTAPHADVECRKCHDGDTWEQRFPGRKAADCRACHQDQHRGQFDHSPRYGQCTSCHLQTTFLPVAFDTQKHALTAFPLTGSHDAVACARCHREVKDGVRTFRGTSTECASCHEDVHKGAFDVIGKPRQVQGRIGCARCHDTVAFSPLRATTFDHGMWTGYALDGAHARAECIQCHPPTAQDRDRRLGKAIGKRCADCHRDQHQGQFLVAGKVDCARCHGPAQWQPTHFDHNRDSRFLLDAQHAPLACDKCHKTYPSAAGPVVRYKPLGTQCGDCHRLGSVKGFR